MEMQLHAQSTSSASTYAHHLRQNNNTFPERARELRAYLNISQFEHIDLVDFAYDAEQPLTTDIMV